MYMKQRLTACSFLKEGPIDEDEETWNQIPESGMDGDLTGYLSESSSESSDLEELAESKPLKKRKRKVNKGKNVTKKQR
eukprot:CAMPEP_0117080294 /NCGR_PEP_ID=MMETSP0472-20121206/56659_1 /TAXON_ID=693140 ORGANISM="Tiarina fusus, Strain LIS" /NCGR_SAMPLE_ID=MMETSP0472 /ASSEMBLY_ACC=CAM_ASM_000603 /LENGTH=78 /DNA_ID=CAMNT_0004807889 /DNA_START=349 /DNA_END=582 /DNA_ORIENTATION=+